MKTSFYPQLHYNPLAFADLAGGLLKLGTGLIERGQANKWLRNNQMPEETIPEEVLQNQTNANQQANTGLPSDQYNKAMRDIQRQQLTSLRFANGRRGGLMALSGIMRGTNDATINLNAQDATQRVNNQRYAAGVNDQVAGWKSRLFDVNKRQPYNRDFDYNMQLKGAGGQNLTSGIDSGIAGAAQLFGGGKRYNRANDLWGGAQFNNLYGGF